MLADRYELDREIGRGGMGAVWLGRDTVLDRVVAIKQIGMTPGGSEPDLDRAEREAHLAARVPHQNVVAVFDLVDDGGHQWLVMEHVDGPTLAELIRRRGALEPERVAPIAEQVARALAAAHAHGIVHRDVKPSNILLTHDGIAKLSDFGVARAQADAALTQTGLVTGSPAYLSPEVATGRTASTASDVWSLGATLFHALAGHPPYEVGDNLLGAMYRIVHEEPPVLDGGGRLAPIVAAMMRREPDERPTMVEVEAMLGSPSTAPPPVDPEATQGFVAFADTADIADVRPTAPAPAASAEPTAAFHPLAERTTPTRRPVPPAWLAAGAAALLVAVVLVVLAVTRGGDDPATDAPRAGSTPSPSSSASPTAGTTTAGAMEGFAADYLMTASNDPAAGFTLLTPGFQDASGGLKGYTGFWGKVSDLDVQDVTGDPAAMTVSYTYSYTLDGDRRSDDVTLRLEKSGDSFLIAGEA